MSEESIENLFFNDAARKRDETSSNALNMRIVMLQNLCDWYAKERTASRSLCNSLNKQKAYLASRPDEALEAVRALFQKSLDKEIGVVVQKFYEKYLVPAIGNIQSNGYEVASSDIFGVYHRILDEAKRMYPIGSVPSADNEILSAPSASTPERGLTPLSIGQPLQSKLINRHIPAGLRRRKEGADSDTDSDISQASFRKKARVDRAVAPPKRITPAANQATSGSTKTIDIPFEDAEKWNPDRIDENTVFVLGSKANSALGLSAQRGRIYIKHPGLFRYVGDHEDKMWLFENKQKTVKFGGKAFLVVLDDIVQLAETPEYRSNPDVNIDDLNGFTLPPFIRHKIQAKMDPVYQNIRSKYGLNASVGTASTGTMHEGPVAGEGINMQTVLFNHSFPSSPFAVSEGGSDL